MNVLLSEFTDYIININRFHIQLKTRFKQNIMFDKEQVSNQELNAGQQLIFL